MSQFDKNLWGTPYTAAQGDISDSVYNANIRQRANEYHRKKFGEGDLRFTTKGKDILYAILLEWPEETLTIESLKEWNESQIKSVHLLGEEDALEWEITDRGLVIQ